jgi:ankyrin repeat protein
LFRTRASCGSLDVLNELLEYEEGCDVDLTNIEKETPLHLAVKYGEAELRALMVDSLLDAGAETRLGFTVAPSLFPFDSHRTFSIKDKAGQVARDYVREDDTETRNAFRRHEAMRSISTADIADGTCFRATRKAYQD